jgi:HEAT repeat protein
LREILQKDLKPVRIAASYALATMPEERTALIEFLLTAPDLLDDATAGLFAEDERALPLFRQRVKNCEPARRALATAGDAPLLVELHQTLHSEDSWEAAQALPILACAKDSADLVRQFLGHHDYQLRMAAYESLVGEGEDPGELLRAASLDASVVIRRWAVRRLARNPATLPMARKFLNDGAPEVREAAVDSLVGDAESRVLIRHLLSDADSSVRRAAVVALADDRDTIPTIEELLNEADPELRVVAAYALLRSGHLSYAELKTGGTM